ncbi:MAG: NosD domain-containing protein, partial [Candidatus Bilamarchaeum sp.]
SNISDTLSSVPGLYFASDSGFNLIFNNYLSNTINVQSESPNNYFNTTKTLGRNVVGGPYLGGNFWSDYSGSDADGDLLGDTSYLVTNVEDNYPLIQAVACGLYNLPGTYLMNTNGNGTVIDIGGGSSACIVLNSSDIIFDCNNFSVDESNAVGYTYAFLSNGSFSNISIQNCPLITSYDEGIYFELVNNSSISNVNITNMSNGVSLLLSDNILVEDSNFSQIAVGVSSYFITGSQIHDSIFSTGTYGIYSLGSSLDMVNLSVTNFLTGIFGQASNVNVSNGDFSNPGQNINTIGSSFNISNNTFSYAGGNSIIITGSQNNLTQNTIYNCGFSGIYLTGSYNTIEQNNITSCVRGITVDSSSNVNLSMNNISSITQVALSLINSNNTAILDEHYFNNSNDIFVNNSGSDALFINMSNIIIDSSFGDFTNYSNLSLIDYIDVGSSYNISWSSNSSELPSYLVPFNNKYLVLSQNSGNLSIDNLSIFYQDSELNVSDYNFTESKLSLYIYDVSWSSLNSSLNTVNNIISSQVNTSGIIAFVEDNSASSSSVSPSASTDGSSSSTPVLRVSLDMQCNNNTITTSVGSVSVNVVDENTGSSVYSGTTDSDGHAMFNSCGRNVRVYANRDGYRSTDERFTLDSCTCLGTEVPPVATPPAPTPTPTTQPAPPLTNTTPPMNNTPSPQPTPAAPVLSGPASGVLGSTVTFSVTNCEDCSVRVEGPDGRIVTLTVTNGAVNLPITMPGNYRLSLVRNGEVVRSLNMAATSPTNVTPSPSAPPVPGESGDNGFGFAILIIIILVVIGGVAYYYMSQRRK